jgi:opacity protein-like surface antigen
MGKVNRRSIFLLILMLGLVCSSSSAQEQITDDDTWQFTFSPYFWAPDSDFKTTTSGITSDVKVDFKEVLDHLDELDFFGFSGRLEAWKGDFGYFFDVQYIDAKYDEEFLSPLTLDLEVIVKDVIVDAGVTYTLFKTPLNENSSRLFSIAPLAGVRYHYLKQETRLNQLKLGGYEDWVEPFVGVLLKCDLTDTILAAARADYGGFGIGSASDHTWNILAGIRWQCRDNMSIDFAYKIYDIDYSRHSGNEEFGMDGQLKGPMIGLTMHF